MIQILITKIEELIGRYREKIFAIKDVQKLKDKCEVYYLQRTKSYPSLELGLSLNKKQSSPFKLTSIPLSLSNLMRTNSYPKSVNIIEQQTQRIIFKELRNIKRSLHDSARDIECLFKSHIIHFPNLRIEQYQREKYIHILVNDPFLNYLLNSNKDSKLIDIINEITEDKNIKQTTLTTITLKHCLPDDFSESCSQCESEEIKIEQQNWMMNDNNINNNKHYNINNINFNILGNKKTTQKIQDTYTSSNSSSSTSIQTISTTNNFKEKKNDMKNNNKDVKVPKDMGLDDWVNYINKNEEKKVGKKKKKKRKKNINKINDDNNNGQSDNNGSKIINGEDETESEILSFKELINKYSINIISIQKIKPNFSKDWRFYISSSFKND